MTIWSLEEYCSKQVGIDFESLPTSTRQFLETLALPDIHPFCNNDNTSSSNLSFPAEGVPPMGNLVNRFDDDESIFQTITTMWYMVAPPLLAMAELWLRLFAGLLGPCGILYLLWTEVGVGVPAVIVDEDNNDENKNDENQTNKTSASSTDTTKKTNINRRSFTFLSIVCILSVASTLVLMTDTLYVLENGPYFGASLFLTAVLLAMRTALKYNLRKTLIVVTIMVLLAAHLTTDRSGGDFGSSNNNNGGTLLTFGDKVDEVKIEEGLYYDSSNSFVKSIVDHWPEEYRTYSKALGATSWMPTGDSRTGLPFLLNFYDDPHKLRLFVRMDDDEFVALDIAFPSKRGHDTRKPIYFLLHGLSGGSNEEYIRDLTYRRLEEGSTVIVMVARGLMDLPVRGWGSFHGARTTDVHTSASIVRRALGPDQVMVGVGYSMGAIILNNYVASIGPDCAFDGAIAISGGLDMRYQEHFYRAQRLWQPMLAETLRSDFLLGKWGFRVKEYLSKHDMLRTLRASHITEVDRYAIVPLNGFDDLNHYYVEMSALGDIPHTPGPEDRLESTKGGKIETVSIPLCVLHALDDPLVTWRTVASNEGPMHPENLVRSGSGNVMVLLTKGGGHVGWPVGTLPFVDKWKWMSDVAMSFVQAVDKAKQESK